MKNATLLNEVAYVTYRALIIVGIFGFFTNILMLTVPLYMMQLYDRVLASHSYETLLYLTLIATIAVFILVTVDDIRSQILIRMSAWFDNKLSGQALLKSPDAILHGHKYGAQALQDILQLRQFIASPTIFALLDWPYVPIYLAVIFILQPALGLIAFSGAFILLALAVLNEYATRQLLFKSNTLAIQAQRYADTALRNAEVIQAMGMMPHIVALWQKKNIPVIEFQVQASQHSSIILSIAKFVRIFLQILLLGVGAYYVLINQLTAGAMIAASILAGRALAPVEQSIAIWKQLVSTRGAFQRLQKHLNQEVRTSSGITLPVPRGEVSVENIFYHVPHIEKPILQGLNFLIQPGELIALIGPSGSGKTTLARLLVGVLKPTVGTIRLDQADVYTWNRFEIGKYIGYLPQDIELFQGTVKDNIARLGNVDDEAVIRAAIQAGVHDIILRFPQGYDTLLNDGNMNLSAGQKQRIAFARALYQDPAYLVLDEPNAHLDHEGDIALKQALHDLRQKKVTQIIITHRPSIAEDADKIIVLNQGKIQLMGPRSQVLERFKQAPVPT